MCIRCRQQKAPEPLGYCSTCALHTRLELQSGLTSLAHYLEAWATFEQWLAERGL